MQQIKFSNNELLQSKNGMVASSHKQASQCGVEILKAGGNAMDAAIAMCAVQCVVEPGSTGIGGDNNCLFSQGGSENIVAYNGTGKTPAGISLEKLKAKNINKIERTSAHSVVIPGAVDAWVRLNKDYGKMPLAELLQPAIKLAKTGYAITPRVHFDWQNNLEHLHSNKNLAKIFLPPPEINTTHKQTELAKALELIAQEGRRAFYEGELAKAMVEVLQEKDGFHTLADFKNYKGEYVKPISSTYRGRKIFQLPPNSQGVIACLLLNMFENRKDKTCLSTQRIHFELESCRRAYKARSLYLGEKTKHTNQLLEKNFAKKLVADITDTASEINPATLKLTPHHDTIYIAVVDKQRNACSFINTLFWGWGSGITTKKYGIVLTNRAESFVLEQGHPNCIAANKRPLHTIIPALTSHNGKIELCFGVMGGEYQAMGHSQFLSRHYDFGYNIQQAQDLPRFMVCPYTGEVEIENVAKKTIAELKNMGHNIVSAKTPIGGSQAIYIDWENNTLSAGSDNRKDGCALGY